MSERPSLEITDRGAPTGVLPWGPLKSGFLSGKYASGQSGPVDTTRAFAGTPTPAQYTVIDTVNQIAAELGAAPASVALAWLRAQPGITSTLIGARTMAQLDTNLAALELELGAAQLARLDEVSRPRLNFPAENNTRYSRLAHNGGTTVDGVPTPLPPQLAAGVRVW